LNVRCWVDQRKQRKPVQEWIASVDDQTLNQIDKLLNMLREERRGLGMPYSRHLGDGLFELRDQRQSGPGYRLYYCWQGDEIVILLVGGDKSSQTGDIETARERMQDKG
jgi:putative addiction module killer protein